MAMTQFSPALLNLMAVANMKTPQGGPTIAEQKINAVLPQAMQPGQPPGMPPQGIAQSFPAIPPQGMQDALDQSDAAAPSVAENIRDQQAEQMLAGAQPQTQMMAEGGIASLPMNDYGYADGGIIGYAAGGEFDLGDSEEARLQDEERVRLIKERQREDQKRLTAEMLGLPYEPPQQIAAPSAAATKAPFAPESKAPPAPELKASPAAALGIASGRSIPSIAQLINEATTPLTAALAGYTAPEKLTPQQLEERELSELRRKGLPEQAKFAEEQGLVELQRQNKAIRDFKEAELARQEAALGSPGQQSMNRFKSAILYGGQGGKGSFAQGLENAKLAEEAGIAGRREAKLKMLESGKAEAIEVTRIQALIDDARRARALGRVDEAQKLEDAAREAANKISLTRAEGAKSAISPAISAYGGMRQQEIQSAETARAAARPTEFMRMYQEIFPGQPMTLEKVEQVKRAMSPATAASRTLTYNEAADNVQKMLDSMPGMMEVTAIQKSAKDAGKPVPSLSEIKEMMVQRELQNANAARSGASAPTGGAIRPSSQADFDALPKGSRYINPADGKEYIKN